ncbi:transposase [Candidatus Parcubacteria bacterium]|nr:transposase [Patescibacteria group bacterium]MBU4477057.1 transposase [Patescibacteria group bacterium]MCG2699187.1 transposase [Candidatus Parcubacteria bacterium]
MRIFAPTNGEIYHIFNRGTEKRKIFTCKKDYERFIVNLILFNTARQNTVKNISRYNIERACQKIPEDALVKIHAFSLLPNHFHVMLEQVAENGIPRFLHRIGMSYSLYFNKLYSRSGNLFQGAYKIKHLDNDAYLLYLPLYIHLNALDLLESERNWKEKGIKNKSKSIAFLETYLWSSLREYLNKQNYPFICRGIIDNFYKNPKEWKLAFRDWLPDDCAAPSAAQSTLQ